MFRFSIREMMLVTLVVATGIGWLVDHRAKNIQLGILSHSAKEWEYRAGIYSTKANYYETELEKHHPDFVPWPPVPEWLPKD
jgi:hypothetical protein